jgi:hypothetical protein
MQEIESCKTIVLPDGKPSNENVVYSINIIAVSNGPTPHMRLEVGTSTDQPNDLMSALLALIRKMFFGS